MPIELDCWACTQNFMSRDLPDNAMFIAESPLVIERALDAGCVPVSCLMETNHDYRKGRDIIALSSSLPNGLRM